jgi:hypothetical protein
VTFSWPQLPCRFPSGLKNRQLLQVEARHVLVFMKITPIYFFAIEHFKFLPHLLTIKPKQYEEVVGIAQFAYELSPHLFPQISKMKVV